MEEDSSNKLSNQQALEKLRELFSDYVDLEQEIYQNFESQLNSFGIKLGFYFPKEVKLDFNDFFSKYSLWQMFCGSVNLPDIFFMDLRMQMSRPWFLSRDFFDIEIIVGSQKIKIKSEQQLNNHFLDLQQLLSKTFLFNQYPLSVDGTVDNLSLAKEFKTTKYFIIKLIRVKKEESGFRKYLELENCLLNSEEYREKLEKILQATVKETLANLDVTEDVIRMHLQERLALWGYRFSKILNEEELISQYSIVKIGNIFPSLLDGALFIQSLTYNSNEAVIEAIKNNKYKNLLNRFLSRLENQKILLMKFNGINLESNPEFLFNIKNY
jgi:hypothetical protein